MLVTSADSNQRSVSFLSSASATGSGQSATLAPQGQQLSTAGTLLLADMAWGRIVPVRCDPGEPPFSAVAMSPREQLEVLRSAQVPCALHPPQVRHVIQIFQARLDACIKPPLRGLRDSRPAHILSLPGLLVQGIAMLHSDSKRLQRKEEHCLTRSLPPGGRKGSRVAHETDMASSAEQTAGARYIHQFGQRALLQCLPAVIEVLRDENEPDLAEFVTDGLAMLQAGRDGRNRDAPFSSAEGIVSVLIARSIDNVAARLAAPPGWASPPHRDPPGMDVPQQEARHLARLQWLSDGLNTLLQYGHNHSLAAERGWVADAIASLQGELETLCDFEFDHYGRERPPELMRRLARASREREAAARESRGNMQAEEKMRPPFGAWCRTMHLLLAWLTEVPHKPAARAAHAARVIESAASGPARAASHEHRRPAAAITEPQGQASSPAPVMRSPSTRPPRARRDQSAAVATTPLAPRPSLRSLPLADAILRLREAARAGPAEADAALRDFLAGRRMRQLLHGVPPGQASMLLETLAALVDRCGPDRPGLGFFPLRDLLDGAWITPDTAVRKRLVDSVLAHFSIGPRPSENPAAFRAFCLGGGLEKLFQVLPAADPAHALAALQALGRRLALQEQDDGQALRKGLSSLAADLQNAVQQRRMNYMASTSLGEAAREASAGDMHAWLAGALYAIAPHARDAGVQQLASRLAGLCGLGANVVPRRPDTAAMQKAALKLLTGSHSANCQIDTTKRRVLVNAHNLDTPVFEALLHELAGRTLASGARAFTAFELLVGGEHDDGAGPASRKRPAVARWMATLPAAWCAQHQGGGDVYLHAGDRPRADWATWNPAAGGASY